MEPHMCSSRRCGERGKRHQPLDRKWTLVSMCAQKKHAELFTIQWLLQFFPSPHLSFSSTGRALSVERILPLPHQNLTAHIVTLLRHHLAGRRS